MIEGLIASGRIVDAILGLVVVQFVALVLYRRATGRGPAPADIAFSLLAGAGLLLALRAALTGADWTSIAAFLVAALAAHLADLVRRWPR
jgi:hypothetical protein